MGFDQIAFLRRTGSKIIEVGDVGWEAMGYRCGRFIRDVMGYQRRMRKTCQDFFGTGLRQPFGIVETIVRPPAEETKAGKAGVDERQNATAIAYRGLWP